jgi:hypothetical protein
MKPRTLSFVCAVALVLASKLAFASVVSYTVQDLGANQWEYEYTVSNDSLSVPVEEFTVFFDVSLYRNLTASATPPGWDPLVIQPDPLLPDDGFYDALALLSGIAPSELLGGFSVTFEYLGIGTPGPQLFHIVDPFSFAVLDSGTTTASLVSTPPTLFLLLPALLVLTVFRLRRPGAATD